MTYEETTRGEGTAVKCDICDTVLDDRDRLADHMEQVHSLVTNTIESASTPVREEDTNTQRRTRGASGSTRSAAGRDS